MDPINPSVIALHGSLVELAIRVNRIEEKLHMTEPVALLTFKADLPPPFEPVPNETVQLRERVRVLESRLALLEPIGGAP